MKRFREFIRKYIPTYSVVCFVILIACALLHIISGISPSAADFLNIRVGQSVRLVLAKITSLLPFSLAELLLYLLLPGAVIIVIAFVRASHERGRAVRLLAVLLATVSLLYSSFVLTLGLSFGTPALDEKLGFSERDVSAEELRDTLTVIRDNINECAGEIEYRDGEARTPHTNAELSELICKAYRTAAEVYPAINTFDSRFKPALSGEIMTACGTLGIYSYFTGESNLNMTYPDFSLPFTVAHEFAHQRGFARENEANFVAFLVCIGSEDPFIRYSGYMTMYQYVSSALSRADSDAYTEVAAELSATARDDLRAYYARARKYDGTVIDKVSSAMNDTYLKINGTVGVRSYGLVVDLAVAYYRDA